jgi:ketosteroid isomerase-like protein
MGERDVGTLNQLRERTMHAENAGDAAFFEGVSAEDVVVMPPGMPAVSGRSATVAFMSAFLGQFDLRIHYVSEEIRVHGNFGFDRGTYSQTLTPKSGGQGIRESGKYLWIYSRRSDEGWEFSRVIWNASESPS